jgi:hypothetical protein
MTTATTEVQTPSNIETGKVSDKTSSVVLKGGSPEGKGTSSFTEISNPAVMEAAVIEINDQIAKHGTISINETNAIIQEKVAVLENLWSIFPGAMTSKDVLEGFKKVVEPRGYTDDNTLFAQSVCPDEVNHEDGDIPDLFFKYLGEQFMLGGLSGWPFTGSVGFGAFSHHVPDDGHCSILYAPHIGLDNDGKFGSYSRDFQSHNGACCGAAVGAYKYCMECEVDPNKPITPEGFQFDYIVSQVNKHKKEIVGNTENEKQASLIRLIHRLGHDMLKRCVGVDYGSEKSTLVVLTGIQINMPRPFEDFFLPIDFYILKKNGEKEDVFEEAFGPRK